MSAASGAATATRGAAENNDQRPRRPRNRNRNPNGQVANPPQQEAGQAQGAQAPHAPAARGGRGGRGRGRGRGRGQAATGNREPEAGVPTEPRFQNRRGRGGPHHPRVPPRAVAQLAAEHENTPPSQNSDLQADAPEFTPGRPAAPQRTRRPPREKRPQGPRSTAQDIATRTHEDIDNGHYECAICTEEVRRTTRGIWSCRTCWMVFHLSCIKKWSTNEGSVAARQQAPEGVMPPPRQWRCPGCNYPKDELPRVSSCWCEKEMDPKSLPGLPPFSCGQTCARPRILPKKCPHPCSTTCHAGPCPPCTLMGPTQHCFCGKNSVTRRCLDTDYENGWSCGTVCGQVMACGEHTCPQPCHEGPCGACEVRIPARCYCGQEEKDILCCERAQQRDSSVLHQLDDGSSTVERWVGIFECPNFCQRPFDCGKHFCGKECHRQDTQAAHCPRSPDVVSHCPCGKTPLHQVSDHPRTSCEDPIPNCSRPCDTKLSCGHACQKRCHQGKCPPCLQTVSINCRCGRTTSTTVCHQGVEEPPHCMRICRISLNCGRHECGERCCSGERKAGERQSQRRKHRPIDSARRPHPDDGFESEHICTRPCGRQLRCGNPDHRCQELCHKGPCGTCRDAIFDEISCNCGRTVLQPPLPCGTQPPPCRYPCERPKDCGHPQVSHNCHGGDENCPICPFLTTKHCLCGKNTLKNQPCHLNEVRCAEVCGQLLSCGSHRCRKQCHRPGECEEPCAQACGKELSACGHPCMAPCHFPMLCKEEKPCMHKILITCECQRIKQEAKCNASKNGEGNLKKTLKCDEECARLQRNQILAAALHVDPDRQDDHVPYSADTLNMYQRNSTWAAAQEKILRLFAANPEEKRMRFKPMQSQQRAFVHSLAEDFGLDTESMDPEPHRHVALFKTPRFVMAPMKTLADCVRIRQRERATAATTARTTTTYTPAPQPKPNKTVDPYNGFLITNPRFALTIEEITSVLRATMPKTSYPLELEVAFLPSEEISLKPPIAARVSVTEREIQTMLESIKPAVSAAIAAESIGKLQLVRTDASLNVQRRESDDAPGAGWSQVAKGNPVRKAPTNTPLGVKSGFAVLSLPRRKKKERVEVADDWEVEEEKEEEKEAEQEAEQERGASGASSDAEFVPEKTGTVEEEITLPERLSGAWADSE
ncbi:uncharacterized protein CC84DRAFT_1168604 [Paraphaeosphaeria sporulosa]|uniref:R3H domain-containing protein n=1 Tax=Paraphaeosphaeria sporulosa TaxID=1460663 RepID=A0A177C1L9_9PLEO|nr:uncharacterized protein CC84DRAFT_1168604 [Paraphaeosphaeria sporulosa]OAG00510.1 hypothetical protein CC84DRAFT_1168604 [Paraphaeosphaeria sporulosa]